MKKTVFLIVGLLIVFWSRIGLANEHPETGSVVQEAVKAQVYRNFEELSDLVHPATLKHFRKLTNVYYEKFLEIYAAKEVHNVMGIGSSPADSALSDAALYVRLMSVAAKLDDRFLGTENQLPLKIHGTVFGERGQAYVVYEYSSALASSMSQVQSQVPRTLTLVKHEGQWKLYSATLVGSIAKIWHSTLSNQ